MKRSILNFSFLLFLASFFLVIGCGGDDDDGGSGGSGDVDCNSSASIDNATADELAAVTMALADYTADQSDSNCNALKNAYNALVDALKDLQDCADQSGLGTEHMQTILGFEGSRDALPC